VLRTALAITGCIIILGLAFRAFFQADSSRNIDEDK
jgi:hypothetical protein